MLKQNRKFRFLHGFSGSLLFIISILAMTVGMLAQGVTLKPLGTYATGVFAEGAAEIVAHDPATQRLFVVDGAGGLIDVLDISDPANPTLLFSIDLSPYGNQANSVDVHDGVVAAAVEDNDKQAPGKVVFFDTDGNFLNYVMAGALPDMITFTPDGMYVLTANEGEPNDDYTVDPEGSVTVVDISGGVAAAVAATADFHAFNSAVLDPSIRIFGPGSSVSQDLEPEYITISKDSKTAYVTCQENNAIAVVDIASATVTELVGLGHKDHSLSGNALDASNEDGVINIQNWPVKGIYMPDAITSFSYNGETYLITANEGDSRDYGGFSEEERIGDLPLDPTAFPDAATLQLDENLGRLKSTITLGDTDNDGDYDELYSYGARSFSVWKTDGTQVYDSGDQLEQITAAALPADFNSDDEENGSFDDRSDDKGPEPEGVVLGQIGCRTYLFLGLERIGGIMVWDMTHPDAPVYLSYINTRDFSGDPAASTAGDMSPEGLAFIPAAESPNGKPLLAVAFEVSGSTTVFEVEVDHFLVSGKDIDFGRESTFHGSMFAMDDIDINRGPGGGHGNLCAGDDVDIARDNALYGDAMAGDDMHNHGTIYGSVMEGGSVVPVALPMLAPFSAGSNDVEVPKNGSMTLTPGTYGKVEVERGGSLYLSSGSYYVEELDGDKNSHIEIDVTNGPVTVYITDDFELGESALVSIVGGGSRDVTFKSIQTKKIDLSRYASLSGTVIAPHAKFNAMSYVYFRGAIYARDIEFGNGVTALHHDAPAVAPKVIAGEENAAGSDLIPVAYALEQNYPNPFNPSTTIRFSLAEAGTVSLKIYNVRGQLVKTLLSSSLEAGSHQVNWNGLNQQGSQVASGVYFYHLQAGSFQQIKKMILMK